MGWALSFPLLDWAGAWHTAGAHWEVLGPGREGVAWTSQRVTQPLGVQGAPLQSEDWQHEDPRTSHLGGLPVSWGGAPGAAPLSCPFHQLLPLY